jgi:hypothetical protein
MRRDAIRPDHASSTRLLLGFVAFWAILAGWAVWLLWATGLFQLTGEGLSIDVPWFGWPVLLVVAIWFVAVISHHSLRLRAPHPHPTRESTSVPHPDVTLADPDRSRR